MPCRSGFQPHRTASVTISDCRGCWHNAALADGVRPCPSEDVVGSGDSDRNSLRAGACRLVCGAWRVGVWVVVEGGVCLSTTGPRR